MKDFRSITIEDLQGIIPRDFCPEGIEARIGSKSRKVIQFGYFYKDSEKNNSYNEKMKRIYPQTFGKLGVDEIAVVAFDLNLMGARTCALSSVMRNPSDSFKGVGRKFVREVERIPREMGKKYFTLSPMDDSLIPYYQSLGFKMCMQIGEEEVARAISFDYRIELTLSRENFDCRNGHMMFKKL